MCISDTFRSDTDAAGLILGLQDLKVNAILGSSEEIKGPNNTTEPMNGNIP